MASRLTTLRRLGARALHTVLDAVLACVLAGALAAGTVAAARTVTIGGPFTLVAGDGTAVTDATYRGKWLLVVFGYTSCPDVCPTTLLGIAEALGELGADAAKVQPLFITVDPARDTPEVMQAYAAAFDPRIVGLTGTPHEIAAVADAYGAYGTPRAASHHADGAADHGLLDHSTTLYVMDPEGQFVRGLSFDVSGEDIAKTLLQIMARP